MQVMAGRIRSIKPELLEDEVAASLSDAAWRLWVSSWTLADDHGDLRASAKYLAANVWQDTSRNVDAPLEELISKGRFVPYAVKGQRYVRVNNWARHQRVDNAGAPRVPTPDQDDGTWNHVVTGRFAESRRDVPRPSESVGGLPLAHSGGETTTTITTTDTQPPPQTATRLKVARRGTKAQIPEDWKPSERCLELLRLEGIPDGVALACLPDFVDYWRSELGLKADWDATFRGRVRFQRARGLLPSPSQPSSETSIVEVRADGSRIRHFSRDGIAVRSERVDENGQTKIPEVG